MHGLQTWAVYCFHRDSVIDERLFVLIEYLNSMLRPFIFGQQHQKMWNELRTIIEHLFSHNENDFFFFYSRIAHNMIYVYGKCTCGCVHGIVHFFGFATLSLRSLFHRQINFDVRFFGSIPCLFWAEREPHEIPAITSVRFVSSSLGLRLVLMCRRCSLQVSLCPNGSETTPTNMSCVDSI